MPRLVICVVALGLLLTACASTRVPASISRAATSSTSNRATSSPASDEAAPSKKISFNEVQLTIPANWPVIDGAHARHTCSSTFEGQGDRAFLGPSYQGVPACPAPIGNANPLPADGVWMRPLGSKPPHETPTTLPGRQVVYRSVDARASAVTVWYHRVLIQIGIGADPAVERAILDSITYSTAADTPVLGRCPPPDPTPPTMPTPSRLTAPLVLEGSNGRMQPEPPDVRPELSARSVWANLFHGFGKGGFPGALRWSIYFGSYSAQTPATINPDGSRTPDYRGVPTWLIRGEGIRTDYGPCGMTVLAPYNADNGHSMVVATIG